MTPDDIDFGALYLDHQQPNRADDALQRGHGAHNLSALIVLNGLWRLLEDGG